MDKEDGDLVKKLVSNQEKFNKVTMVKNKLFYKILVITLK